MAVRTRKEVAKHQIAKGGGEELEQLKEVG